MSDLTLPSTLSTRIAFSDEQAMLLDSATAFCRERSPSAAVRQRLATDTGFDASLWQEIGSLGWAGIAVPERFGGSGLTLGHTAVIAEPMGRHLLATPFGSSQLAIQGLLAGGSAAQQAEWLPRLAAGTAASVALFEDDGDWDLGRIQARASVRGSTATLQGAKTLVVDGGVAELLLVSVARDGAPALAVLPTAGLPAGALQRETIVDETRRSHRLVLDGLQLPASALIDQLDMRALVHRCPVLHRPPPAPSRVAGGGPAHPAALRAGARQGRRASLPRTAGLRQGSWRRRCKNQALRTGFHQVVLGACRRATGRPPSRCSSNSSATSSTLTRW